MTKRGMQRKKGKEEKDEGMFVSAEKMKLESIVMGKKKIYTDRESERGMH